MEVRRNFVVSSWPINGAIGAAVAATAGLIAFPDSRFMWQAGAWTLAVALLALLVLVPVSAYSLATNRDARTWQRIASFSLGLACLAVVGIGSL